MGCELGNLCCFYWLEIGIGWQLGKMEDSPGSSHLEGELPAPVWILHKHPALGLPRVEANLHPRT